MIELKLSVLVILSCIIVLYSCSGSGPSMDLLTAIDEGNIEQVQLHIDSGTNINDYAIPQGEPWEGVEPLILAVLKDNLEIAQLLIDNGADIEIRAKDKNNSPVLHWAVYFQLKQMVPFLIKSGANVNSLDRNGFTPLDTANLVKAATVNDPKQTAVIEYIIKILNENAAKTAMDL